MRHFIRFSLFLFLCALIFVGSVNALERPVFSEDAITGAQLYDKWYAVEGAKQPVGNMPIWERQKNNSRSGPETWRCSECHGWDYLGSEGVYKTGSHATGFPNVMKLANNMTNEEIVSHLKGSKDPSHNFSQYLSDADLLKLAVFLHEGVQDESRLVDKTTLKVIGGSLNHGKQLYDNNCAKCHGQDGKLIIFRSEGINEFLGSVAVRDPYRFIHRTRFGTAGVKNMPVGLILGFSVTDEVDLLAYAQNLPAGTETVQQSNAGINSVPSPKLGGPQGGVFFGFLAGITAFFGMIGVSITFLLGLIIIGMMIVWLLRKRN